MVMNVATAELPARAAAPSPSRPRATCSCRWTRPLRRKLSEVFVTYRMERDFTKEQILATYLNVVLFGQRSYGIAAAAETYYGKPLDELTVAQAATLAGIIQLPSRYNPVTNPKAAEVAPRLCAAAHDASWATSTKPPPQRPQPSPSPRAASRRCRTWKRRMWPSWCGRRSCSRFGEAAVNAGYKVFTTLDGRLQTAANRAAAHGPDRIRPAPWLSRPAGQGEGARRGRRRASSMRCWSKHEAVEPAAAGGGDQGGRHQCRRAHPRLAAMRRSTGMDCPGRGRVRKAALGAAPRKAADVRGRGRCGATWSPTSAARAQLAQLPQAQSALVALDPDDGAIVSLVGGFDFYRNKFNRVTQARRQPGSGFKPFLYSAALEEGFTPASVILDMPPVLESAATRKKLAAGEFRRGLRRADAAARGAGAVAQPGVDPHPADHRRRMPPSTTPRSSASTRTPCRAT